MNIPYLYHVKFLATAATATRIVVIAAATVIVAVVAKIVASAIRVRHPICGTRHGL